MQLGREKQLTHWRKLNKRMRGGIQAEELQVSYICDTKHKSDKYHIINLLIKEQKVEFNCDSGVQVNVLNLKQCMKIGPDPNQLMKTKSVFTLITKDELQVIGK